MYKAKLNIISTILVLANMNLTANDDDSLYFQLEPDSVNLEIGDSMNVKESLLSRDGSLSKNPVQKVPYYVFGFHLLNFSLCSCK